MSFAINLIMKKYISFAIMMAVMAIFAVSVCSCGGNNSSKSDSSSEKSKEESSASKTDPKAGDAVEASSSYSEVGMEFWKLACKGNFKDAYNLVDDDMFDDADELECLFEVFTDDLEYELKEIKFLGGGELEDPAEGGNMAVAIYSYAGQKDEVLELQLSQKEGKWVVFDVDCVEADEILEGYAETKFGYLAGKDVMSKQEIRNAKKAIAIMEDVIEAMKGYFDDDDYEQFKMMKSWKTFKDIPDEVLETFDEDIANGVNDEDFNF